MVRVTLFVRLVLALVALLGASVLLSYVHVPSWPATSSSDADDADAESLITSMQPIRRQQHGALLRSTLDSDSDSSDQENSSTSSSTKTPPPPRLSSEDADLLGAVRVAALQLRVYVYEPPLSISSKGETDACLHDPHRKHFWPEQTLPAYFANSTLRTRDPDSADIFLLPHNLVGLAVCHKDLDAVKRYFVPLLKWVHEQPSYARNNGRDHAIVYTYDNGAFCDQGLITQPVQALLSSFIMIGNYGVQGMPNCFNVDKDIVIPQWHDFSPVPSVDFDVLETRPIETYFKGQIVPGRKCSVHAREYLQNVSTVVNDTQRYSFQTGSMEQAYFGLAPAVRDEIHPILIFYLPQGHACWSLRFYDAIFAGSIPIIVADNVVEPFERFLRWREFAVKIQTAEIPPPRNTDQPWFFDTISQHVRAFHLLVSDADPATPADLQRDYIVRKRKAGHQVQPWFTWDKSTLHSAFGLLILELWCRTDKGARSSEYCKLDSSTMSNQSFW